MSCVRKCVCIWMYQHYPTISLSFYLRWKIHYVTSFTWRYFSSSLKFLSWQFFFSFVFHYFVVPLCEKDLYFYDTEFIVRFTRWENKIWNETFVSCQNNVSTHLFERHESWFMSTAFNFLNFTFNFIDFLSIEIFFWFILDVPLIDSHSIQLHDLVVILTMVEDGCGGGGGVVDKTMLSITQTCSSCSFGYLKLLSVPAIDWISRLVSISIEISIEF